MFAPTCARVVDHEHRAGRLHDAERAGAVGLFRRDQRRAQRQRIHVGRKHLVAPRCRPGLIRNPPVRRIDDRALAARRIHRLRMLFDVLHVAHDDAVPEAGEVRLAVVGARRVEGLHLLERAGVKRAGLLRTAAVLAVGLHLRRSRPRRRRRERSALTCHEPRKQHDEREHEHRTCKRAHMWPRTILRSLPVVVPPVDLIP